MRAPSRACSYPRTSCIAKHTVLIASFLAKTSAATLPAPPSPADQWLYPDVNTVPTYNYLDTVNASWTSNFVAPYLLLRCQHPDDTVHYAYPYNQSVSATGSALVPLDDGNAWVCHFQVSDLRTSSATPPTFISNDFNIVLHNGQKPVLWTNSQEGRNTAASRLTSNPATTFPTTSTISTSGIRSSTTTSFAITAHSPLSSTATTPTTAPTSPSTTTSSSAIIPPPTQPSASPTPSSTTSGLSKSQKVAITVGATMGALLLLIIAIAVLFLRRTRRSERNAVVYRSGPGNGSESKEVSGSEAPRERWKGVEIPSAGKEGYF